MFRSTFSKLFSVFIACILLYTVLMVSVFYITLKDTQTKNRLNALKSEAYDIAYLAGVSHRISLPLLDDAKFNPVRSMMERKIQAVYNEYQAYCMVVDRKGDVTPYFLSVLQNHQDLASAFDVKSIVDTLLQVMAGNTVETQVNGENGPMFTVAVPWIQNDKVSGAVFIQTAAQTVRASYEGLWGQIALAALASATCAGLIIYIFTKRMSRYLQEISAAARQMSQGISTAMVKERGADEFRDLALSFNTMSRIIQENENRRREFIANLSHELRSPMTNISGFIEGMLDGTIVKEEDKRQYLGVVLDETRRLSKLVEGLLKLSRAENAEIPVCTSVFNLCELARIVLITKISQIEIKHIDVQTIFEEEALYAAADRDMTEQLLINLLDNAIKFTPEGGNIGVRISKKGKNSLSVIVEDNGRGISEEDRPYIFERFYKADKAHQSGQGTGLGLAISKSLMEKQGQSLVLLQRAQGAAFEFTVNMAKTAEVKHLAD